MIKTFNFRIKDSTSAKHLDAMACSVNFVWNFCNNSQRHALLWDKKWPTGFDLSKLCAGVAAELGLHSQTVQAICEEYARRRQQSKRPYLRYRGKRSLGWIPFKKSGLQIEGDCIIYKGHHFRFWDSREIEGAIKTGSFSQDARGRWYVNITCEVDDPAPSPGNSAVGIDLGLKTLAVTSDGEQIEAKRFYRDLEPALATAQQAGKKKKIKAIHARIANRRKDFLHKASTRLVEKHGAIIVGNVNAAGLAKTKMAKSVLDAGWSMFRTYLSYKATARKVWFQQVNEAYTTQTCSSCGCIGDNSPKGRDGLEIREWACSECGDTHDRDINAAKNILALGHQSLAGGISFQT